MEAPCLNYMVGTTVWVFAIASHQALNYFGSRVTEIIAKGGEPGTRLFSLGFGTCIVSVKVNLMNFHMTKVYTLVFK